MRNRRRVSSEVFPLYLELFLSGGAGAPLAPLAETPMLSGGAGAPLAPLAETPMTDLKHLVWFIKTNNVLEDRVCLFLDMTVGSRSVNPSV